MNYRSRPVRSVVAVADSRARTLSSRTPTLTLPLIRWEYRELYEKDENYDVVLVEGEPTVVDAWVTAYFLVPDGSEICAEFDRAPFDRFIFPALFAASVAYWEEMSASDPLFPRRSAILEELEEMRKRLGPT